MKDFDTRRIRPVPVALERSVDDLGRIVIPSEMRKALNIQTGDKLSIYMTRDGVYMEVQNKENDDDEDEEDSDEIGER